MAWAPAPAVAAGACEHARQPTDPREVNLMPSVTGAPVGSDGRGGAGPSRRALSAMASEGPLMDGEGGSGWAAVGGVGEEVSQTVGDARLAEQRDRRASQV
jgi:hypothetical protein